jgi:hypothetical protein
VTGGDGNRRAREHQRPIVRALPVTTAHPSSEAWSAIGEGDRSAAFARLQKRMPGSRPRFTPGMSAARLL